MNLSYKITNNRMVHILGVARKCYELSVKLGLDEKFCEQMYLIGFLHDIGYDFTDDTSSHAIVGADIINALFNVEDERFIKAIQKHGITDLNEVNNLCYLILNYADMTVNSLGESVLMEDRLNDIKLRYGEMSPAYLNAESLYDLLQEYFQV